MSLLRSFNLLGLLFFFFIFFLSSSVKGKWEALKTIGQAEHTRISEQSLDGHITFAQQMWYLRVKSSWPFSNQESEKVSLNPGATSLVGLSNTRCLQRCLAAYGPSNACFLSRTIQLQRPPIAPCILCSLCTLWLLK